jgi:hypothetical protein
LTRILIAKDTIMRPLAFSGALLFLAAGLCVPGNGMAAPKGVVELFTSQGCSSCPPADATLNQLIEQGDVIALAYHVDYWDYLGWKDTFSSRNNTERQYGYAKTLKRNNVYTPQAVINGASDARGGDFDGINAGLDLAKKASGGLSVPVSAKVEDEVLHVSIGAGKGAADIVVVYYAPPVDITMERGENAGKTVRYSRSVTEVSTVGMWDGKAMSLSLPMSVMKEGKNGGCAILLQSMNANGNPGAILGAADMPYTETD